MPPVNLMIFIGSVGKAVFPLVGEGRLDFYLQGLQVCGVTSSFTIHLQNLRPGDLRLLGGRFLPLFATQKVSIITFFFIFEM